MGVLRDDLHSDAKVDLNVGGKGLILLLTPLILFMVIGKLLFAERRHANETMARPIFGKAPQDSKPAFATVISRIGDCCNTCITTRPEPTQHRTKLDWYEARSDGAIVMSAGAVVVYFSRLGGFMYTHERVVLSAVAEAIAEIKHCEFAARFDDAQRHAGSVFFVPDDTLIADEAAYLGIRGPNDLYGGVVPYPLARTKAITHRLVDACANRPEGWSSAFPEKVKDVVLPGYTVFNLDDARVAARRLLELGPIRIKEPLA